MKTQELLDTIAEALERERGSVTVDDSAKTLGEWDSIGHLKILARIDEIPGVSMDMPELESFKSVKDLVAILKAKGVLEE